MAAEESISPTLRVVNGPNAGRLFPLDRDRTVIGRNPECDIVLTPKSVSRRHAAISRRGREYLIEDLGSTRGTYVGGVKLSQPAVLNDAAPIQLGDIQLMFQQAVIEIYDEEEKSTIFASIDMKTPSSRSLMEVRPAAKLRALMRINQVFGSALAMGELIDQVLTSLFEIFPRAERGFVLLLDRETGQLAPTAIRTRSGPTNDLKISKTILERVLKDGQAILSKDVMQEFPLSESLAESTIRSIMCAPILDRSQLPIGVVQIDTRDGRGRFNQEDLDLLVSVAGQISFAVQNAKLHQDLLRQRELEKELMVAREVMQALLPERPASVPGYTFWHSYEPARQVGGDYFGFIPLGDPAVMRDTPPLRWAIAVGDVVGKGLPAALLTAKLSAEVRLFLQTEDDPAAVVSRLNRQLFDHGVLDMFVTFLLAVLDVPSHRLTVVNAGHCYPVIRRQDGSLEILGAAVQGFPLAIQQDGNYQRVETSLEPGELMVLTTDGIIDALSPRGERFTDARLHAAVVGTPADPAAVGERILAAVRGHMGTQPQFDDITLVVVGRT